MSLKDKMQPESFSSTLNTQLQDNKSKDNTFSMGYVPLQASALKGNGTIKIKFPFADTSFKYIAEDGEHTGTTDNNGLWTPPSSKNIYKIEFTSFAVYFCAESKGEILYNSLENKNHAQLVDYTDVTIKNCRILDNRSLSNANTWGYAEKDGVISPRFQDGSFLTDQDIRMIGKASFPAFVHGSPCLDLSKCYLHSDNFGFLAGKDGTEMSINFSFSGDKGNVIYQSTFSAQGNERSFAVLLVGGVISFSFSENGVDKYEKVFPISILKNENEVFVSFKSGYVEIWINSAKIYAEQLPDVEEGNPFDRLYENRAISIGTIKVDDTLQDNTSNIQLWNVKFWDETIDFHSRNTFAPDFHFPCAESAGSTLYEVKQNKHLDITQRPSGSSIDFYSEQNSYHHNLLNGYKPYTEKSTGKTICVPLHIDIDGNRLGDYLPADVVTGDNVSVPVSMKIAFQNCPEISALALDAGIIVPSVADYIEFSIAHLEELKKKDRAVYNVYGGRIQDLQLLL